MKEILIVSNYYPPERGAASNRIKHLAEGLKSHGFQVQVVCPFPNYPKGKIFKGYKGKLKTNSTENGINVKRLWLYPSVSKNKFIRFLSMLSFSVSLLWFFIFSKIPKTVIVQSPPLLVAFTAVFFLRSKRRKLVLNVSDLWPLAGVELKAYSKDSFGYKVLEKMERFNYTNADLILGQSQEILDHVSSIDSQKRLLLYRNFPDFTADEALLDESSEHVLKIVYAGLLGVAQGIRKLCDNLDYSGIEFHIYGTGAERKKIVSFVEQNPNLPVFYHGEVSRDLLHRNLINYDIAIIPLLNRIYGSVPSKIFEYAKLGLPILYFGGGEGERIVEKHNLGWVATAADYDHLNHIIQSINKKQLNLSHKKRIKMTADQQFSFESQLQLLLRELES